MKKLINDPQDVVREALEGYARAYSRTIRLHETVNGVLLRAPRQDKVTLVIGGGSGHEPMFSGFVGKGLADAAACGNVFASPDPGTVCETALSVHGGRGVLFVYGCYAGDNLNFDMAEELLADEGVKTAHVRVSDDCASAPLENRHERRGIAGDVFVVKIAGAACDAGMSLEEAVRVTETARDNTRSIGIALSPGYLPGSGAPTFTLADDEIEYGMGLHGEPGIRRAKMCAADEMTDVLYDNLMSDMALRRGDEVCVLVNGLGSTTLLEMGVVHRRLAQRLDADGIAVYDADLNSYCTCQEMGGVSISLLKLDDALKRLYSAPCSSPYYTKG